MNEKKSQRNYLLLLGIVGCLCFGGGDWLMIYGNPLPLSDKFYWLTQGIVDLSPWRLHLAMALAFPGILFYGAALFSLERYITDKKRCKVYHYLNAFGLTPWMALHLFYIMIFYVFNFMQTNGMSDVALRVSDSLAGGLFWIVYASEAFMLPVFLYWFYLVVSARTSFKRGLAFANVLVFYAILYAVKMCLPVSAFRLGFTNGLMSESMVPFFLVHFFQSNDKQEI